MLLFSGCLPATPPDVEPSETITLTPVLIETVLPTVISPEAATPTAMSTKTVTPAPIATRTAKPTIKPTQRGMVPLPDPLFAISYLYKDTLRVKCIETDCIREIYVGDAVPFERPYKLGSAYYLNPASMFITLYTIRTVPSEEKWAVLHINPETGEVKAVNISPKHRILVRDIAHERLVLVQDGTDKMMIVQEDLSLIEVDLESKIFQLIEAADNKVIAVNDQPIEQDGQTFIETFFIDVRTGEFTRELVKSPPFANWFYHPTGTSTDDLLAAHLLTVSSDLEYVYLYYNQEEGDEFHKILGKFDTNNLEEVNSVIDPNFLRIGPGAGLYNLQYRNISYPRAVPSTREYAPEGIFAPIDLTTLRALIERCGGCFIAPFGDNFAIGTRNSVFLLSLDGEIIGEYSLPYNGGLTYQLVEYKK